MFIPRVYFPVAYSTGEEIIANEKIAHYLTSVLRLRTGSNIIVFNGQGGEYTAEIHIEKKKTTLIITGFQDISRESPLTIHLGVGLARGDRMDLVFQKATELGVTSITPLFSQHCAVKLDEARSQKRLAHWQNIAISACEQSGRTLIPTIHTPIALRDWVKQIFTGTSIVFDIGEHSTLKSLPPSNAMRVAVGPESGWDIAETAFMIQEGFTPCHLGPRVLRAETASITVMSLLQGCFGDLA